GDDLAALDVHDGDEVVVLIGDIKQLAGRIEREVFRVSSARQGAHDLVGAKIEHFDVIAVAGANVERLLVFREQDAARALAYGDRLQRLEARAVDNGDRVVLLVRHIDSVGRRNRDRKVETPQQGGTSPSARYPM